MNAGFSSEVFDLNLNLIVVRSLSVLELSE